MKRALLLAGVGAAVAVSIVLAPSGLRVAGYELDLRTEDSCVGCHAAGQPEMVAQWRGSPHFRAGVGCEACHGSDHEQMFAADGAVSAAVCAEECHPKALTEFRRSKHSQPKTGAKADLLPDFTKVTGGCAFDTGCHAARAPYPDGSRGKCSVCHPSHAFALEVARDPATCITCHSGSNNTEGEEYAKSIHGVLHRTVGPPSGPSCVTCHMPGGTHDDSGATTDLVADSMPVTAAGLRFVATMEQEEFDRRREAMLSACDPCHGRKLARRALEEADAFRRTGALMLEEAARIVHALYDEQLLVPMPEQRRANPLAPGLVLGSGQIFDEETSAAERIFYRMYMFTYSAAWRRAYHNTPALVTWHENEMLRDDLIMLRAEARRLRREEASSPVK